MPDGGGGGAIVPSISDQIASEVSRQVSAILASANPVAEATQPSPGMAQFVSRMDHVHPRLTSTDSGTLSSVGEATISFTRTFATKPSWFAGYEDPTDGQPVVFKIKSWTQDANGIYIGCVLKGYRSQLLPALSGVSLLTGVITALANLNVFAGNASGVNYSFVAIASSK